MSNTDFDQMSEEYVRETLGWEFDLLRISQKADEAMRDEEPNDED